MAGSPLREGSPYKPERKHLDYIPGKVLVRFKTGAMSQVDLPGGSTQAVPIDSLEDATPDAISAPVRFLQRNAGLKQVRSALFAHVVTQSPGVAEWQHLRDSVEVARRATDPMRRMAGMTVMEVDAEQERTAVEVLRTSEAIEAVELMPARWLLDASYAKLHHSLAAIDWHIADRPKRAAKVAVLDTGVDAAHPNLSGRIEQYETNGFSKRDLLGHGTHVAGIISGRHVRSTGFRGVCAAKLRIWKIFDDVPEPTTQEFYVDFEAYMSSLAQVLSSDVRVVNLSIGGTIKSAQEAFVFKLLHQRGIVAVAPMGNEYEVGNPIEYPAAYPGVLAVGAVDNVGKRARFSNTGRHIGLVAPGVGILSTVPMKKSKYCPDREFASYDGTSMASPIVAAAASWLLGKHPELSAEEVFTRIKSTAQKLPVQRAKGYISSYGAGLLNLKKLLA